MDTIPKSVNPIARSPAQRASRLGQCQAPWPFLFLCGFENSRSRKTNPHFPALRSDLGRRSAAKTPPLALSGASPTKQIPSSDHRRRWRDEAVLDAEPALRQDWSDQDDHNRQPQCEPPPGWQPTPQCELQAHDRTRENRCVQTGCEQPLEEGFKCVHGGYFSSDWSRSCFNSRTSSGESRACCAKWTRSGFDAP